MFLYVMYMIIQVFDMRGSLFFQHTRAHMHMHTRTYTHTHTHVHMGRGEAEKKTERISREENSKSDFILTPASNLHNLHIHTHTHTHTALMFEQIYLFRNAIDYILLKVDLLCQFMN